MRSEVVWFLIFLFSLSAPLRGADDPLLAFTSSLSVDLAVLNGLARQAVEIGD
jgi:hypothetical protein